jgi:hypothetical protein
MPSSERTSVFRAGAERTTISCPEGPVHWQVLSHVSDFGVLINLQLYHASVAIVSGGPLIMTIPDNHFACYLSSDNQLPTTLLRRYHPSAENNLMYQICG